MTGGLSKKDENRLLRKYYRLILSYPDFKHAVLCAKEYISKETIIHKHEKYALERAVYCSMIVAYSRPFNSQGIVNSSLGKIPFLEPDLNNLLTEKEKEIHDYVIFCRNSLVAHSDAEILNLDPFDATDLPGDMVVPLKRDGLAPFTEQYTMEFLALAEKMMHWSVEERERLEPTVKPLLRSGEYMKEFGLNDALKETGTSNPGAIDADT